MNGAFEFLQGALANSWRLGALYLSFRGIHRRHLIRLTATQGLRWIWTYLRVRSSALLPLLLFCIRTVQRRSHLLQLIEEALLMRVLLSAEFPSPKSPHRATLRVLPDSGFQGSGSALVLTDLVL